MIMMMVLLLLLLIIIIIVIIIIIIIIKAGGQRAVRPFSRPAAERPCLARRCRRPPPRGRRGSRAAPAAARRSCPLRRPCERCAWRPRLIDVLLFPICPNFI